MRRQSAFRIGLSHGAFMLTLLTVWEVAASRSDLVRFVASSPLAVLSALHEDILSGVFFAAFSITALEAGCGLIIGSAVGSIVGLVLWCFPRTATFLEPYVVAFGATPLFALAPVLIVWFGTGVWSKIWLASLSSVGLALLQSYRGAIEADHRHVQLLTSLGARRKTVFLKVIVPSSVVWVFAAYRLNVGLAITGAFIGEFLASSEGLGYRLLKASGLFDMARVGVGLIGLVLLAFAMAALLRLAERLVPVLRHRRVTPSADATSLVLD